MDNWRSWFRLTSSHWLVDIAIWLILAMPLIIYAGVYQPFSFGRYALFMFVLVGLALGLLFTRSFQLNYAWWRQPVFWLSLVWLIIAIISAMSGVNPFRSWWGTVSRGMGIFFFIGLWLMGWWLLLAVNRKEQWLKIFSIISWVGGISGFYALLQQLNIPGVYIIASQGRVSALMGNPIFLGQLLLFTIFLTVYFITVGHGRTRWYYAASLILQIIAIFLAASRGPLLGLAIAGLIWVMGMGYLYRRRWKLNWRWLIGGIAALGVVATTIIVISSRANLSRIFDLSSSSVKARLFNWETAWQAIQDRPILGYGNENAWYAFTHFYKPGLAGISFGETIIDRAHNFFLDQLLANGWVGLVTVGLLLGYVGWGLWRFFKQNSRQEDKNRALLGWSLLVTLIAYLSANMTAFDTVATAIYGGVLLAGIIALISPDLPRPGQWQPIWLGRLILGILLVGLIFFDGRYLAPALRIGYYTKIANTANEKSDYRTAAKAFAKAQETDNPYRWSFLTNYPSFARKYAILLIDENPAWANSMAEDGLRVAQNIQRQEPDRVAVFMENPLLFTVLSLFDPHYAVNAENAFNDLVKEFPNHEYIYLNWARSLMGVNKYPEAKKVLDQLAAKFPVLPQEFEFWRAVVDIRLKSADQQHIINDLSTTTQRDMFFADGDQDVLRLAAVYLVNLKQWQLAEYYQKKIVNLSPTDVAERINLSAIYKELGEYDKAAEQARIVVKLDPSRLDATKQFLQSIGRSL